MAAKKTIKRDDDLSKKKDIREDLLTLFKAVEKGFANQQQQINDTLDFWEAYNCELGDRQFYSGTSKIYVPIIRSALNARRTRFVNQMFPMSGRHVEVVTGEQDIPHALVSLIEHYIGATRLRTQVLPALLINGDIEGQYTVYIDWNKVTRHVVSRETKPVEIGGMEIPEAGEIETITEEEIVDAQPGIEIIADADFLVLPVTADSLEQALEDGGSVTVLRRWSKAMIRRKIDDGDITEELGEAMIEEMTSPLKEGVGRTNTAKELATAAGIKLGDSGQFALIYETWSKVKVNGERRICRSYYGGQDRVAGCKINPYWCDRVPCYRPPFRRFRGYSRECPWWPPAFSTCRLRRMTLAMKGWIQPPMRCCRLL